MKRLLRYYERHYEDMRRYDEKRLENIRRLETTLNRIEKELNFEEVELLKSSEFLDKAKDAIKYYKRWWENDIECIRRSLGISKNLACATSVKIVYDDAVRRIKHEAEIMNDIAKREQDKINGFAPIAIVFMIIFFGYIIIKGIIDWIDWLS